jgi:protein-arginine kinase activator protein McsA
MFCGADARRGRAEVYEKAAELRDAIKKLNQGS